MKIKLLAIALLMFPAQFSLAQEDGAKLAKSAGKALAFYNMDPVNNSAKLAEAMNLIEQSLKTPEVQGNMSAWLTQGNIYNTRLQSDMIKKQVDSKTPYSCSVISYCDKYFIDFFFGDYLHQRFEAGNTFIFFRQILFV